MKDKKAIAEYVERVFDLYGLNKRGFFYDYDEESEEFFDCPLFVEGYESEEKTIQRVSQYLGLATQEIVNCDKRAAFRYCDKYPYFALHHGFLGEWAWNIEFKSIKPNVEERIMATIFDIEMKPEPRYDWKEVKKRLCEKLKEVSEYDSKYYPPDSELKVISAEAEVMFSYPKCCEMVRSFLDMVYRAQSLFFKAMKEDLQDEEQLEYNFLVSYLKITDIVRPSVKLYYYEVVRLRNVLLSEGYNEFWSYAKVRHELADQQPWRCVEFFEDIDLVQEFVNVFPKAKKDMIEFSRLARNIRFTFQWKRIKTQEEKDEEFVQAYLAGREYDENFSARPILTLYLEKTEEECSGFQEEAEKLRCIASPPSKGGVRLPKREYDIHDVLANVKRIEQRFTGGN